MKKFIILALVTVLSIEANAQKITWDKTDGDGFRSITTTKSICSSGEKKDVSVGLDANVFPAHKDTTLYLSFYIQTYSSCSVPKGGKLLIKLFDDSIMELSTPLLYEDNIGKYNSGYSVRTYRIYPRYKISKEQIEKITYYGVKKIRIELYPSNYDKEFTEDKIGKNISITYPLVEEALKKNPSFSDGF